MPCIYYGTEIGMVGGYDPDCGVHSIGMNPWDKDLLTTVKIL
ncbi:MAG: hypothetical protein ACLTTW_06545 [Coprobacter sp.]